MFILAVVCAYSPLCPAITVASLLTVFIESDVAQQENNDLFYKRADSGGRLFRLFLNRCDPSRILEFTLTSDNHIGCCSVKAF